MYMSIAFWKFFKCVKCMNQNMLGGYVMFTTYVEIVFVISLRVLNI